MASPCSQAYFMVCPIETKTLPFNIANKLIMVRSHKVTGMFIKFAPNLMLRFSFGPPISDPRTGYMLHQFSSSVQKEKKKLYQNKKNEEIF